MEIDNYEAMCSLYERAKEAYFINNIRIISDAAYDELEEQIQAMIYKGNKPPKNWDSLEPVPKGKNKIPHWAPVQKIRKVTFDKFKKLGINEPAFYPKLDGVALFLKYEYGVLTSAITRGNGKIGVDVLKNTPHINGIPSILDGVEFKENPELHVQGEVVIPKGHDVKNKRNKASSALLYRNEKIHKGIPLMFILHSTYPIIKNVIENDHYGEFYSPREIPEVYTSKGMKGLIEFRDLANVEMDGVVCLNDFELVAIKFPPDYGVSKIEKIIWSEGAKGKKTPVAQVTPIVIKEKKVRKVNLYNKKYLKDNGIKEGKTVKIILSGDTIPVIDEVFED